MDNLRSTAQHTAWFATGVIDVTPGRPTRLPDIAKNRSGMVLAE